MKPFYLLFIFFLTFLFSQNLKNDFYFYSNQQNVNSIRLNTPEETKFLEICDSFYNRLPSLEINSNSAYNKIISDINNFNNLYNNSQLKDEVYLLASQASRRIKNSGEFNLWLDKIITECSKSLLSPLCFANYKTTEILTPYHSSFTETAEFAKFLKAQLFFNDSYFADRKDLSKAESLLSSISSGNYNNIITELAQYNLCYVGELRLQNSTINPVNAVNSYIAFIEKWQYEIKLLYSAFYRADQLCLTYGLSDQMKTLRIFAENIFGKDNYYAESRFGPFLNRKWNKQEIKYTVRQSLNDKLNIINEIFQSYQTALNSNIKFVNSSNRPDIIIDTSDVNNTYLSTSSGSSFNEITRAQIYLRNRNISDTLKEIITHEIGHALGLGHSYNSDDIMYLSYGKSVSPVLSERDKKTLNMIYSSQTRNDIISKDFKLIIPYGSPIYLPVYGQNNSFYSLNYSLENAPSFFQINSNGLNCNSTTFNQVGIYNFNIVLGDSRINAEINIFDPANPVAIENEQHDNSQILLQIFPNPSYGQINIKFSLGKEGLVTIKKYNILGELVNTIYNKYHSQGNYYTKYKDISSAGIYLYYFYIDNRLIAVQKNLQM